MHQAQTHKPCLDGDLTAAKQRLRSLTKATDTVCASEYHVQVYQLSAEIEFTVGDFEKIGQTISLDYDWAGYFNMREKLHSEYGTLMNKQTNDFLQRLRERREYLAEIINSEFLMFKFRRSLIDLIEKAIGAAAFGENISDFEDLSAKFESLSALY